MEIHIEGKKLNNEIKHLGLEKKSALQKLIGYLRSMSGLQHWNNYLERKWGIEYALSTCRSI